MSKTAIKRLEKFKNIALQNEGQCLSCIYKNNITPLNFKCKRNHKWSMKPSYAKDGVWCKKCKKIDILEGMKEYAKSRGGKCLSKKFITSKTKLTWECGVGHIWESNSAKYNESWCPYCAKSMFISEAKCRFILEKLTGHEFKTNRSILKGLELDGYCKKLNLAFEYQGKQHFKFIKYFHRHISLNRIKEKDSIKIIMCKNKGISLLIIPYWENSNDDNLLIFIKNWLTMNVIKIHNWNSEYWGFFYESFTNILINLQTMAAEKMGHLLSTEYHGASVPLIWQCEQKHIWKKTPSGIQQGHWCPHCNKNAISKRNRHPIFKVQNLANENNTELVSKEYKNNITPLDWKCNVCQNVWNSTLNAMKTRLLKNKWCLFCKVTSAGKE